MGLSKGRDGGERTMLLLEQRAGAGAGVKGSPREHSSNGEDTSAGQGQQGHSDGRREDYSQGSHQTMKACYARIRKW